MRKARIETVRDLLDQIEQFFQIGIQTQDERIPEALRPRGMRATARIRDRKTDRAKRSDSTCRALDPTTHRIVIEFDEVPDDGGERSANARNTPDPLRDVIDALLATEREGRAFVSLVWFRENRLGFTWAAEPAARHEAISQAVQAGVIEVRKIPNPKNPQYPVSTITLNRGHPLVRERLADGASGGMFAPVEIDGPPLSATILEGRR